eukprot:9727947-Karenia_brevis.AAC.1
MITYGGDACDDDDDAADDAEDGEGFSLITGRLPTSTLRNYETRAPRFTPAGDRDLDLCAPRAPGIVSVEACEKFELIESSDSAPESVLTCYVNFKMELAGGRRGECSLTFVLKGLG